MIAGDFNFTLNSKIDRTGTPGPHWRKANNSMMELMERHGLIDIWRLNNPELPQFTWRRCNPTITQSRLDYFLISDSLQQDISSTEIIPSICSDHSAVTLNFDPAIAHFGPSYWKLNTSLLRDSVYIEELTEKLNQWLELYDHIEDKGLKWDLVKYEIKKFSISFSKLKAKTKRNRLEELEKEVAQLEREISTEMSKEKDLKLQETKAALEKEYDYVTEGAIIRSRVTWHEKGEKRNKYFLGLENKRQKGTYPKNHWVRWEA